MQHTVVVTIGRNVGDKPMTTTMWSLFKTSVWLAINVRGVVVQSPFVNGDSCQLGTWEGTCEDAAAYVAFVHKDQLARLASDLASVAREHNQQCIGFIAVPGTEHLLHA